MADGWDWLEGISGGLSGIVKGIDAGMAPIKTWEGIRTTDLSNDAREINNRDLLYTQDAREGDDTYGYYTDKVGAEGTANRYKMAKGESDIFGIDRNMALQEYLSDPNGAFQQGLKETGWTPGTPEYREWLAEAMQNFDPSGAVAAYDKMGIPGIENRNLNEQAALNYIENYAKKKDPGATVQRMPDGTVAILDSNGEMTPVPGDLLIQTAAMLNAKTPYDAISQGLKDEGGIQKTNIDLFKALTNGQITPAVAFKYVQDEGVRINQAVRNTMTEIATLEKQAANPLLDDDAKATTAARIVQLRTDLDRYKTAGDRNRAMLSQIVTRTGAQTGIPGAGGGVPLLPGPAGGTSVTTPRFGGGNRPPIADILNKATGGGGGAPWGASSQGPAYPRRQPSPQDTGVRPITQGNQQVGGLDLNQLMAFLQMFGGANA